MCDCVGWLAQAPVGRFSWHLLVIMVRSLNMLLLKVVCNMASVSTSTAAVASSRTRILLGVNSARARETSCLWPEDKLDPPSLICASSCSGIDAT